MAFAADGLPRPDNYLTEATAKRFEQSCKCKPAEDHDGDNERLAKLAAPAPKVYDIVVPTRFCRANADRPSAALLDKAQPQNLECQPGLYAVSSQDQYLFGAVRRHHHGAGLYQSAKPKVAGQGQ